MFAVEQRAVVAASRDVTWRMLTDPALVSEWFADVDRLAPGEPFRFDFGDGDFFAGRVLAWSRPEWIRLEWQFMGIGPHFHIEYGLEPCTAGTGVRVADRGAVTRQEASGLGEGWADFLSRLETRIRTGTPSRYAWSPTIGTAALAGMDERPLMTRLLDPTWWRSAFPAATVTLRRTGDRELAARFADPAWNGGTTDATVTLLPHAGGTYAGVVHVGWDRFPREQQVGERRRYAGLWAEALRAIEERHPMTAARPAQDDTCVAAPRAAS